MREQPATVHDFQVREVPTRFDGGLASPHIVELQSLRGLAALLVALSHMSSIYALPAPVRCTIDAVLNAHAAIVVFFVLSGFVLSRSMFGGGLSAHDVLRFYAKRAFRLFPAIWAASAVSLLIILFLRSGRIDPPGSAWFAGAMSPDGLSPSSVLLSLAGVKTYLIPPVGTILIEMVGSLALPFIIMAGRGRMAWVVLVLAVVAVLFAEAPHRLDVFAYLVDFALGAWVAQTCGRGYSSRRGTGLMLVIGTAATLFFRAIWNVLTTGGLQPLTYGYAAPVPALVEALGAAVIVKLLAQESAGRSWLSNRAAATFGDWSYSFYLLHFAVMTGVASIVSPLFRSAGVEPLAATMLIIGLALPLTAAMAYGSYRWIELPGVSLGRSFLTSIRRPQVFSLGEN